MHRDGCIRDHEEKGERDNLREARGGERKPVGFLRSSLRPLWLDFDSNKCERGVIQQNLRIEKSDIIFKNNKKGDISMSREFKRSMVTILLLIPLTLLIPNSGFAGGEEPCLGTTGPLLPPYIGTLIVEWVPVCDTGTNCVVMYGTLNGTQKGQKDIHIKKREPVIIQQNLPSEARVRFLSLQAEDIKYGYSFHWQIDGQLKCLGATSASDPEYKTGTLFTVDVVVMEVQ
jgi:hypothetical protein